MRLKWSWIVAAACIAVFFAVEIRSVTAAITFTCGFIARRYLVKWFEWFTHHPDYAWLYVHARAYGAGTHKELLPTSCPICTQKSPD